jgi:EmrB/QacA subfamily drug resistance transporter
MSVRAPKVLDPRIWKVACVVFIGPFMAQLDSTVVNVSLSTIRDQLHASIGSAQWIISGYLLALVLMLPLNGWLVDRLGAKRLYLGCFTLFTVASMLCGASNTINELIMARLIQGMAGGLMAPLTQMMIARVAGDNLAKVMGYMAVPVLTAPILGPVVAGAIVTYASWPWLFYLNLPTGIIGVGLAFFLLPPDNGIGTRRPFDLLGFLLISPSLALLLYGLQNAADPYGVTALSIGILLMAGYLLHARLKGSDALLDLQLFSNRVFATSAMTQFLSNGVFYARQFVIPLFLVICCHLSANRVGWLMACMGIGMMCTFPLMGFLTERFGCRKVSAGGALLALLGMLPFVLMDPDAAPTPLILVSLLAMGAGQGAINIPSMAAAYATVSRENLALATTAINISQRLGGPLVTTLVAITMAIAASQPSLLEPRSFTTAFVLLIVLQALTLGSALRLPLRIATIRAGL